ncbi:transportin MOS14-like isoform X2 [Papaver somniferum]|uniref:transportin MOS14-like isoform X2 n=1 Tax=Papaver somniferum TaxID=3469 RepID=UPI000E6F5C58|nr:transportin MOS14-like isoform X2 [Papaver somniferum]
MWALVPKLPLQPQLHQTVIEILMSGMSASEDSAAAAALAFRHICNGPADDYFLLASRCILYCGHLFDASAVFPPLADGAMIGNTTQVSFSLLFECSNLTCTHLAKKMFLKEACNSIMTSLSDVLDLANSS